MNQTAASPEPILDPDLPIVDPHHHLWVLPESLLAAMDGQDSISSRTLGPMFRSKPRYLLDEFLADLRTGHNVVATVYVDAHTMYRSRGPEHLRSVGEVEFVRGIAAMAASGIYGDIAIGSGIVGGVDLRLGDAVEEVLAAHVEAGGGRYRGVRSPAVFDEDDTILGKGVGTANVLSAPDFRAGFKRLRKFGLSFDVWLFEPQLPDLVALARECPETQIVLDHVGTPMGVGRYAGRRQERFNAWRENIDALAGCGNVAVKLGGLGIPFGGFESYLSSPPATSAKLAEQWKPYIETCIDAFGVNNCMFESNFPVDYATGSYAVLWNAFKRIVAGATWDEKTALFSGTARRVYRLDY